VSETEQAARVATVEGEGLVAQQIGENQRVQAEAAETDAQRAEREAIAAEREAQGRRLDDAAARDEYAQGRTEARDILIDNLATFQGSADERRALERQIRVLETGSTGEEDPMTTAVGILGASSVLSRQAADADAAGDFEGAAAIRERANALSSMATDKIFGNQDIDSIPIEALQDLFSDLTEKRVADFEEVFGVKLPPSWVQSQTPAAPAPAPAPAVTPQAADLIVNSARDRVAQPRPYYSMPTEDQVAEMTAWNLSKQLLDDMQKLREAESRPNNAVTPAERTRFIEQLKSSILEKQTKLSELGI